MKMRISIIGSFLLPLLFIGCATRDLAVEKSRLRNPNRTEVAAYQPTGEGLPAIAEPPAAQGLAWGGNISPR